MHPSVIAAVVTALGLHKQHPAGDDEQLQYVGYQLTRRIRALNYVLLRWGCVDGHVGGRLQILFQQLLIDRHTEKPKRRNGVAAWHAHSARPGGCALLRDKQESCIQEGLSQCASTPGGKGVAVKARTATDVATLRGLASQALWPRTTLKNRPTTPDMTVPPAVGCTDVMHHPFTFFQCLHPASL